MVERRPLLRVALDPFTAAWLSTLLGDDFWEGSISRFEANGRPALARALRVDRLQLLEARRQYAERRREQEADAPGVSASGSAEAAPAEMGAGSVPVEITTAQAADLLGCTSRRVRQLIGADELSARAVGRSWLVDRRSVSDLLEARRGA